jgi:hypothetical protein
MERHISEYDRENAPRLAILYGTATKRTLAQAKRFLTNGKYVYAEHYFGLAARKAVTAAHFANIVMDDPALRICAAIEEN